MTVISPFMMFQAALVALVLLAGVGCSYVRPAGTLGLAVDGDTHLRPIPTDYNHVPPKIEPRAPLMFQLGF